jgi:phage shock protein PspC (stress-responsive transcriptional regulator)
MRGLDLPRQPGWIGGVCAGIASRLGIDPIIVRGIVVVVAVLGGPAVLLYAAAWLLLPDHNNKIHLEQLFHGRFEAPAVAIGVLALLAFLPVSQGFWGSGLGFWGVGSWGARFGGGLWTLIVIGLIVWFVIWMTRRSSASPKATPYGSTPHGAPSGSPAGSAFGGQRAQAPFAAFVPAPTPGTSATSAPSGTSPTATTSATAPTEPLSATLPLAPTPPTPPATPASGAPAEDMAAWREAQALWKAQHDAFRSQQAAAAQATNRAAQERARLERAARRQAEVDRRARTRSNPLYSFIVIGLSLIAGGLVALTTDRGSFDLPAIIAALATTLAVLAAGIIINGILGKRPGGASAFAILTLIALGLCTIVPQGPHFQYGGSATYSPVNAPGTAQDTYVTAYGDTTLNLTDFYRNDAADNQSATLSDPVTLVTGVGNATIVLPIDEYVHFTAQVGDGSVVTRVESAGNSVGGTTTPIVQTRGESFTQDYAPSGAPKWDGSERRLDVTVLLGSGSVTIVEPAEGVSQ